MMLVLTQAFNTEPLHMDKIVFLGGENLHFSLIKHVHNTIKLKNNLNK